MTSSTSSVARQFVEVMLAIGVREAVLSPGSRSGPLALALAAADAQGLLRLHVRLDERESGFLALGLAKASGLPVPIVTTSGTAAANLHPAVLEAAHARIPIIAVTADRPARLRGTGANQTTNQLGLLPPLRTLSTLAELPTQIDGPVHLNLELDQPLIESGEWEFDAPNSVNVGNLREQLQVDVVASGLRTVVVAGDSAPAEIGDLAAKAGWPILAEPTSCLRSAPTAVATGRLLLGVPALAAQIERVISIGHATISRPVTALLSRQDILILHLGNADTFPVPAGANVTFHQALDTDAGARDWLDEWLTADTKLQPEIPADEAFQLARLLAENVPTDAVLTLGPSQVLRDCDLMFPARQPLPRVLSNRGLAGIDGVLSTAIGATLASNSQGFAFVGDLTFLHGSNGLLIGEEEPRPHLTIVVLNDDGGSIFASLEQGAPEFAEHFERVYATPVGARIEDLCRGFNVAYERADVNGLPALLARPKPGLSVVEVRLSRAHRRDLHKTISSLAVELF